MRPIFPLFIVLLLALPVHGSWTQGGGGASHGGTAMLADKEWDVVAVHELTEHRIGDSGGLGLAERNGVLYGVEVNGDACRLLRFPGGATGTTYPCQGGRLIAMTATGPLACLDALPGDPYMVQWSLSGSESWTATTPPGSGSLPSQDPWVCGHPAIDGLAAIVPFTGPGQQHRIEWISLLDGSVTQSVFVPLTTFMEANETAMEALGPLEILTGQVSDFQPRGVSMTDNGIVVTGRIRASQAPAAAALAFDGTILGGVQMPSDVTQGTAQMQPMSRYATSRDELAAIVMGTSLLSIDPGQGTFRFIPVGPTALGATTLPAPAWNRDALLLPTESGAYIATSRDAATTERFEAPEGAALQDIVLAGDAQAFAVTAGSRGTHLVRLDARSGDILHQIPLPLSLAAPRALEMHLLPAGESIWVWTGAGQAVQLAPATGEGPALSFNDLYPKVDSPVTATVGTGAKLIMGWGDGKTEIVETGGTYNHRYERGGDHTVRLTRVSEDNLTATTVRVLHVGADAPQGLNLIQNAFSDDNWEVTVTAIGFSASAITILFGLFAARRGRRRLEREMRVLDRIGAEGREDPFEAVKDLHAHRDELRMALRRGRIEDSQYALVKAHADHILQVLRQRILGGFGGNVSAGFGRLLDVALMDGRIGGDEADGLVNAAHQEEALPPAERERLATLVRSWQSQA